MAGLMWEGSSDIGVGSASPLGLLIQPLPLGGLGSSFWTWKVANLWERPPRQAGPKKLCTHSTWRWRGAMVAAA